MNAITTVKTIEITEAAERVEHNAPQSSVAERIAELTVNELDRVGGGLTPSYY